MSLSVPLVVTIGSERVTKATAGLQFRKEALGGLQSVTLTLNAPLSSHAVTHFDKLKVVDGRNAIVIGEGRVSDPGRTAGADGQTWAVTALGPANHAGDINLPLVYVDQSQSDGWRRIRRAASAGGSVGQSTKPGNLTDGAAECVVMHFDQDKFVDPDDELTWRYERLRECGQKLARFSYDWDSGVTSANFAAEGVPRTDGNTATVAATSNWNTAGGSAAAVVVTDWPNGRNTLDLRAKFSAGASVQPGFDTYWASFSDIRIRAMLLDTSGADITTGYSSNAIYAHEVIKDLLGRCLPQYDGPGSSVDTSAAFAIDSLVYPDGISPREVMDDLMLLEPAYYWTTGPDVTGNGYQFWWKLWPTSVRYEATLEDGGDFPATTTELYNGVMVRYRDVRGRVRGPVYTSACPSLDDAGIYRQAILDVGDEIHTSAGADRLGANFLANHKYPANAGTLNVARPIKDLDTGRMVAPHEIEPGELIRVRGVESYPDALNASSNDGQTVFRIWAMTYTSDANTAVLELDTYPRTTWAALAKLQRARPRKR